MFILGIGIYVGTNHNLLPSNTTDIGQTDNNDGTKYDMIHDYVFNYRKDSSNNITIAFSEIEEPIRDYYIEKGKASKIGDVELVISQWEEMYIVNFESKGIYFDIETTGVTENELVELLKSIINKL